MAPSVTDGPRTAEFLLTEANGWRSREKVSVTVAANTTLKAGQVLEVSGANYITLATSNNAAGILYGALTNDTGAPVNMPGAVVVRDAEIRLSSLSGIGAAAPAAGAITALRALGLIMRP